MKNIIVSLVLILVSVAHVADARNQFELGARYEVGSLMTISDSSTKKNSGEFVTSSNTELYGEWKPFDSVSWLGMEVSGQLGNTSPKTNDYDLSSNNAMSAPAVTLKAHFNRSWVDLSLGGGYQLNQGGGGMYQTSHTETSDLYAYDPVSGTFVYAGTISTNVRDRYPIEGAKSSALVQIDANFLVWKGLTIGLDAKYTPMATTTIDFTKRETSRDGGPWNKTSNPALGNATFTKTLQFGVALGYSF